MKKYPIIKCRKPTKNLAAKKKQEREKLAKIFNSMLMENQRTVENLPSLWKNLKRKAKVDFAVGKTSDEEQVVDLLHMR